MIYFCSNRNRRALVLQSPTLNGIDFLEVSNADGTCNTVLLTLLKDARSANLSTQQVQITGGAEATAVTVESVSAANNDAPFVVRVTLGQSGNFAPYTLSLVANPNTKDPPPGFDPALSTVEFSFKAGCPSNADCEPCNCCPPDATPEPDINYLAKDFAGFRQVMLDRMATVAPAWMERHESDMGIALIEVLAYVADHLSYQQDAAGTEAYLGTARSRISLRRHSKLVDYRVGEGSNARTWVYLSVLSAASDGITIPAGTLVFPLNPGMAAVVKPNTKQAVTLLRSPVTFATMHDATLRWEQNRMRFYTWSDANCCLPKGATSAALYDNLNTLQVGTYLVFEEVMGPDTGDPQDANPNNRWAVRLTGVRTTDYLGDPLVDPLNNQGITEISWDAADALPFPLCISSTTDAGHNSVLLPAVSVALGNIVPADHGVWQQQVIPGSVNLSNGSAAVTGVDTNFLTDLQAGQWLVFSSDTSMSATDTVERPVPYQVLSIASDSSLTLSTPYSGATLEVTGSRPTAAIVQELGVVPPAGPAPVTQSSCSCTCKGDDTAPLPRFYPELRDAPVTFAYAADYSVPAAQFLAPGAFTKMAAQAQVYPYDEDGQMWSVVGDLLSSSSQLRDFVLEVESTGAAFLRFGDDEYGKAPETGQDFHVRYRTGNGTVGDIARDSLAHIVTPVQGIGLVRNPLPAAGGVDPETKAHITQVAPYAFQTQLRAVTEDDYGTMAELNPAIREARGTLRWTGSWYTAFVSVDGAAQGGVATKLLADTKKQLNLYRMMGVDLEAEGAVIVGLRIEMSICVAAGYIQADVETALMDLFTTGNTCTGEPGLLNASRFSFGETVYTSPFIAAAQAVDGVASVTMTAFQRMSDPSSDGTAQGFLTMGRLELPRCDNDPNRLDHGILVLSMDGGR
jgi:hypothetical protein